MDDLGFAQSRGDDDLFDDELIPIEPTDVQNVTQQLQDTSIASDVAQTPANAKTSSRGGRGSGQRGTYSRGLGRGGRGRGAATTTVPAQQSDEASPSTDDREGVQAPKPVENGEDAAAEAKGDQQQSTEPARPQAVRGDRTATGGVKKPKLTEEELTAKMAEAKARSTALSEAHARAQADAASFEERERIAQEKRKQIAARDAVNRKVMNDDREANRRRKMQAQGIREWDAEKNEEDFGIRGRGRGGNYMRGAHGGVRSDRRPDEDHFSHDSNFQEEPYQHEGRGRGRGRGSRGRGGGAGRGGSGRGRGGTEPGAKSSLGESKYAQLNFHAESEFPALPPGLKQKDDPVKQPERPIQAGRQMSDGIGESGDSGTWADQVESSVAAK